MPISGVNGGTPFPCKFDVEGVQTVVPTKPTDPRESSRILVPQNLSSTTVLQRRFHVLLCYNKASDEDSGWLVAGRIKESLGRALQEQPLLAGRLRRCEGKGTDLEVVSNDSGVRLVEAKAATGLGDFVEMMKGKKEGEAELVFWEDVLEHNPQFSPLFYVQVTNFSCGGYSIGISCSLLLVDPFVLTTFLKKWSNIHNSIVNSKPKNTPKLPTFYLPNHGKPTSSPSLLMGSNTLNNASESLLFNIPSNTPSLDAKALAAGCIDEAERVTGRKVAPSMSLFVKVPREEARVEIWSRRELLEGFVMGFDASVGTWDELELELESVCFNEGKKPVYVSCWINSVVDEGSVMILPFGVNDSAGIQIVVTFT